MSDNRVRNKAPTEQKRTRGEKCIFIHIAITLSLILVLIIIYVIHICVVKHEGYDAFRITRRTSDLTEIEEYDDTEIYEPIGVAFIDESPQSVVCNTILLRQGWSLAPAHCVSIRSDPELSQFLPKWKIRYKTNNELKETDIKKGLVHSYFNRDNFDNNVGLFKHMDKIMIPELIFPEKVLSEDTILPRKVLTMAGWRRVEEISTDRVGFLRSGKCSQFVSPIIDAPRSAEVCVVFHNDEPKPIDHGAALLLDSQIVGFFSWGDRKGEGVPLVIINIAPYRTWLENMMTMIV